MNACPNTTLPEWKKLEAAVGTFEANRDYMETDGEIRSPEEVQKLMKKLKMKLKEWLLEQKTMEISLLKTVLWAHQELY